MSRANFFYLVVFVLSVTYRKASLKTCIEKPIELRVENAEVICSGIVRKVDWNHSDQTYGAFVQLNHIAKGASLINDHLNISLDKKDSMRTKPIDKADTWKNLVYIKNFGSKVCESDVRPNDVRIFLLKFDSKKKHLELNSSLIRITPVKTQNFEIISNNFNFNFTKYIVCGSLVQDICSFDSTCLLNQLVNHVKCECDISCDINEMSSPVCGSDGISYKSICHLKQSMCLLQKSIKIINHDSCDRLEEKLCKEKICPNYSVCKLDKNGRIPECVCPSECEEEPDQKNNMIISRIVCGTDGQDYSNFCELKKYSCSKNRDIKIAYFGKCNPCHDVTCSYPSICKLNSNREAECVCDYDCEGTIFKPVCGSNGKTYFNECFLNLESCRMNIPIRVFQNFDCAYVRNPCDKLQCDKSIGSYCEINLQGKAFCKCRNKCEKLVDHVCGSDRISYENECVLHKEACFSNQMITRLHAGICGTMNPCVDHKCNFGGQCEMVNGVPLCKCIECSEAYKPVCGSDGVTYNNICKLRYKSCNKQILIEMSYEGVCDRCKSVNCPYYGTCVDDGMKTSCACQDVCADIKMPVCGSNGVTYQSICHLQLQSCNTKQMITVLHNGGCDLCSQINCLASDLEPVCGTDGITHANECHLKLTACITKIGITVAYRGPCDQNHDLTIYSKNVVRNCEECGFNSECFHFKKNNTYKCLCTNFDCSNLKRHLVCGSNGILYENKCQLERDECLKQAAIAERPVTECSTPCKGFQRLINIHTNQDYFCKNKNDCPADSYCDMRHSKCCLIKTSYPIERSMICHKDSDCIGEGMLCHFKKCVKNCTNTEYGCCDDGRTPAKGPTKEDCPKVCNCHPAGSYNQFCDPVTGNCPCRPGVLGKHCDSCSIGYWGIKKILDSNTIGCLPCSCNKFGSLREDCNQENGQCQCKKGVYGLKCNECPSGSELNSEGCVSIINQKENLENLCSNVICNYPGSYCSVENGIPTCVCNSINCESDEIEVCGQDGQTYASKCDLMRLSCNRQISIEIAYYGKCTQANLIDALAKHNPWHKESRRHRTNSINKTINQQYYSNNVRMQNSHENSSNLYDRKSQRDNQVYKFVNKTMNDDNFKTSSFILSYLEPTSVGYSMRHYSNFYLYLLRLNTYQASSIGHNIYDYHEKLIPYGTKKCKKDYNCGRNMECIENICYCIDDFIPENEHCIDSKALIPSNSGHNQKRFAFNPCKSKPCFAGSYCENINNSQFICLCPLGRLGNLCEKRYNSILFPSFRPKSFLELNPVEINLNDFVLDLEFKPSQLDGTMVNFICITSKHIDFFTIFLKNGKIKLAVYQSGIGFELIETSRRLSIRRFYKLFIRMKKRFLFIQLDNQFPYTKTTTIKSWTKMHRLILGNIDHFEPIKQKMRDLNVTENFHGCIQYLKLKNQLINLSFPSEDIKNGANIEECPDNECLKKTCHFGRCKLSNYFDDKVTAECACKRGFTDKNCKNQQNPCLSSPCYFSNTTTCVPTTTGFFQCICPENLEGEFCEKSTKNKSPFVAKLAGRSFIEKPPIGFDISSIEMIFYSNKPDGILFYNRGFDIDQFIGAKIHKSFFHLIISIGQNYETIVSRFPIDSNKWNKVRIIKQNSRFKIFFNYDKEIISSFKYNNNFNLSDSLYIGGVKERAILNKKFKMNEGLDGAIQKANFNRLFEIDLRQDAILLSGILAYKGYPCNVTCQNQGVCIPRFNTFECRCLEGFSGKMCQRVNGRSIRNHLEVKKKSPQSIYFDGHTEMLLNEKTNNLSKIQSMIRFEIVFRPKSQNGLLLFTGNNQFESYLYLALINDKLEYSFSLPNQKQTFYFRTKKKINKNFWSFVKIERYPYKTSLMINNKLILNSTFDEVNYVGYGNLVTDGFIRLGGYRKLPSRLNKFLKIGFQGCIKEFKIDNRLINLMEDNLNNNFYPNLCSV